MPRDDERDEMRKQLERDMETAVKVGRIRQKTQKGSTVKLKILERNMEPAVQFGDIVEVCNIPIIDFKVGDLIVYRTGETFLVRRISKIFYTEGEPGFLSKADATGRTEPAFPASQVIGKVVSLTRRGERIVLSRMPVQASGDLMGHVQKVVDVISDLYGRLLLALEKYLKR
jgi:hypothetical protein